MSSLRESESRDSVDESRKVIRVTILASEWGSSKGGLSTINRELAIQLAKCPEVEITFFLPQCSQEDKKLALKLNVKIVEATPLPGFEQLDWLCFPPEDLQIDIIVGHGIKLGKQAQIIKRSKRCKWVQVVHTDPEELGMFKNYSDPISKGEEKHKTEVELCEMADHVVGVGSKLSEAFRSYLRSCQKDDNVVDFTPGVFVEFAAVKQALSERQQHSVLVFGRGDVEDFELKGFDIAGKAVAELKDTRLVFVGAPDGKHEEIAKRLTECGVPPSRLRVRRFVQDRESLRRLFQEVDLVVMPSRTEGFGLTGLEALSAGLPVLVSRNSGFGEALLSVPFGSTYVVNSEEPADWTSAIKTIWVKNRRRRLEEAETLCESYGKKYNWAKQIKDLVDKMISWVYDVPLNYQSSSETKRRISPSADKVCQRTEGTTVDPEGSSSVLKSTQGKTNYSRLCRLLISTGSRVLRDTFDSIIPAENLREFLKRDPAHSRLQILRKKRVLTSVHWSKLYPATPTEVSSASFDIPLLIVLLRTICNLSSPPAGWDTPPLTADTSRESDIARIKYFMNAVSKHAAEGSFSDAVFNSYWQQICDTLVRLGGADYGVVINEMKYQDIEFLDGEHFRELLKQWKKVEDDIKEKLNELETEEASMEEAWNVFPSLQNLRRHTEQVSKKTNLPSDLRTIAANKGLLVSDNQASGNCLFYALSEQLQSVKGIQISHKELRKTLVQFLDENPNLREGTSLFNFVSGYSSWREYLQSMAKDGNWGDHVVLFAAANRFQTPIRIISSLDHEIVVHPDHALANSSPLVLGHIHELHYVSLQPRQGSSSVLKSSQGELNYSRLCLLLISTGSRVLRDTFDSIIPPENLRELLKRDPAHSRLQLLRKKGVLTSVHWRRLYPATPTEVSSASFDIPLLIVLLRTICNLRPPPAGWDTPPLTADTSRESDIARIKYFVNAVSKHATEGSVSDAVFSSYWQQICNTLVRLGGADYEDLIDEFKDQDIEFLDEEHFRELLKQWKKVEDDIRDRLNEVESQEAAKEKDPGKASSASGPVGPGVDGPSDLTKQAVDDQDYSNAQSSSEANNRTCHQTEGLTEHHGGLGLPYPTDLIEKIRQLYKTRERRLLPVPWLDEFSFHINDIFTRLKILGKEKTQGVLTDDITNMTAIFKAHAECQRPRTVLIEGDPGMGKTTYCQKLAYDWATKQNEWDPCFPEIEVLLLLKCHEIKSDIWKAIEDQILPEEMDTQAKECFFKFIRENQSKVLLVLDGLDEADTPNLKMFSNLIESKELSGCYIVLTSRHEAGRNARRYCDTLWEIVGFTREDAVRFIHKYFKNVNKEYLTRKLIEMVWPGPWSIEPGQPKDLHDLTKNPLNTTLLCVIWEDLKGVFPTSRTELYIEIVLFVLGRYEAKKGLSSENEDLLSVYSKDLLYLGRMALESLQNGELYFEEHKSGGRCIVLSKIGFLSLQPASSKRKVRARYAFPHKSFQEFFSGFFLACKLIEGEISCESVVTDKRYERKLYQVFAFLLGILVSKSKKTAESLVKSVAANINFTSLTLDKDAAKDVSKRILFALSSLSEHASLLQTLGEHLNFTQLNLRESLIDNSGAASLSQALAVNSSLTSLNLSTTLIEVSGAVSLSQALAVNSSLTNVDLSNNLIGDSGAASLSQALAVNSSLTDLDLSGNSIGDSGAASLSHALAVNSSLTILDLSRNLIGTSGAASLSQALAVNCTLTKLDLS